MIQLKTKDDIKHIKESGSVLCTLFDNLDKWISPEMTTWDINQFCANYILKHGYHASCLGYEGYPSETCISVNEEVIHGIPSKEKIVKTGDIISVDIVIDKNGNYFSDSTRTFIIGGKTDPKSERLVKVTKECLSRGIEAANKSRARLHDIGAAVFNHADSNGFGVIRDYCGHGVGFDIHEEPNVPNYVSMYAANTRLREGMVIAIEPMISMGSYKVHTLKNNWTVVTNDGSRAAHWEHTIAITANGAEIMTLN